MICDVNFKIKSIETSNPEQLRFVCAHLQKIIDAALSMTPRGETIGGYDCTYFDIEEVKQ